MSIFYKNPNSKISWRIFLATSFGVGLASIDSSIIKTALPTISEQFNSTFVSLQWVVTGYLLVICAFLPLAGRISDIYTRRRMYLIGMIIFTLSSVLCGLSNSLNELIIFRLAQGLGAALLFANNQALVMANFPKKKLVQALSINAMIFSFGSIVGPTLGGFLMSLFSWRSIFFVNIPIGVLGILMCLSVLPKESVKTQKKLDFLSAIFFAIGITALLIVISYGEELGWFSFNTLLLFLFSIIAFYSLYQRQIMISYPLIDINLLRNKHFLSGNIMEFFVIVGTNFYFIILPFYLQSVLHIPFFIMGIYLFIPGVFLVLTAPLSGFFAERFSSRLLILIGLSVLTGAFLLILLCNANTTKFLLILIQSLIGIGYGIFQSPNNYRALKTVPSEQISMSSSIISLSRSAARIFGVSIGMVIFETIQRHCLYGGSILSSQVNAVDFLIAFKITMIIAIVLFILCFFIAIRIKPH